jgi:hypothetical protein
MNAATIAIVLIVGIAVGIVIAYLFQRNRSFRLRERFGPEYSRTVAETGDRWRAETALEHRAKRVERLHIRTLTPVERRHFLEAWHEIQGRFVDDPNGSLVEADHLIASVMSAEGYPVSDFEQQASDISVDHAEVVENYRGGHRIVLKEAQGRADTEDLRQGMIHYRSLFEDLVGQPEYTQTGRTV